MTWTYVWESMQMYATGQLGCCVTCCLPLLLCSMLGGITIKIVTKRRAD